MQELEEKLRTFMSKINATLTERRYNRHPAS
jgi:hypothetical protein